MEAWLGRILGGKNDAETFEFLCGLVGSSGLLDRSQYMLERYRNRQEPGTPHRFELMRRTPDNRRQKITKSGEDG